MAEHTESLGVVSTVDELLAMFEGKRETYRVSLSPRCLTEAVDRLRFDDTQRPEDTKHVDLLHRVMERGEFEEGSQIKVLYIESDKNYVLGDGNHRWRAASVLDRAMVWDVQVIPVRDVDAGMRLYGLLDSEIRKRTVGHIIGSDPEFKRDEYRDIPTAFVAAVYGGVKILGEKLHGQPIMTKGDVMDLFLGDYREAALELGDALYGAGVKGLKVYGPVRQRLVSANRVAVALHTVNRAPAGKAVGFWSEVVANPGGLESWSRVAHDYLSEERDQARRRVTLRRRGVDQASMLICFVGWFEKAPVVKKLEVKSGKVYGFEDFEVEVGD